MRKPTIRASEMDRVLNCPGSLTLNAIVDPREGDEGFEGTMLHWMIADRAIRELGATPPDGGLPPPEVPAGYKLPSFSLWIVDWAIRHIREVIPPTWSLLVEVPLAYTFGRWDDSGHIDILGLSPDAAESHGIDWKTGRDPVDPADHNEQVLDYKVLVKRAWRTVRKSTFQIAQPRADEASGFERVSTAVLEGDMLDSAQDVLDERVNAAIDQPMELNSGRKQCKWCSAAIQCPAYQADMELMRMTMTPEMLAKIRATPDDKTLGDFVITGRMLTRPMEDATNLLHERLEKQGYVDAGNGTRITVKVGKGAYSVPNPPAFYKALTDLVPDPAKRAGVLDFSMIRAKAVIAEVFDVQKTSVKPDVTTAESIFDAKLRPLTEQGERRTLIFQ